MSPPPSINVQNPVMEGVNPTARTCTFLVDVRCLTLASAEAELRAVGALQMIAPMFHVVVLSESALFDVIKPFGWALEHFMSPENQTLGDQERESAHEQDRLRIMNTHYREPILVSADEDTPIVEAIAAHVGAAELAPIVRDLTPREIPRRAQRTWPEVLDELRHTGRSMAESAGGRVQLTAHGPDTGLLLIRSVRLGATSLPAEGLDDPRIRVVDAQFSDDSSCAFETFVHSQISQALGKRLAVVAPVREASLWSTEALHWIDVGLITQGGQWHVAPVHREPYSVVAGGSGFNWDHALRYAAARRISRRWSTRL